MHNVIIMLYICIYVKYNIKCCIYSLVKMSKFPFQVYNILPSKKFSFCAKMSFKWYLPYDLRTTFCKIFLNKISFVLAKITFFVKNLVWISADLMQILFLCKFLRLQQMIVIKVLKYWRRLANFYLFIYWNNVPRVFKLDI